MSKQPINDLDNQLQLIKRLREMHMEAFSAFTAYETIQELRAPNVVGQSEAHANAEAIGNYRYFFNIAVHSLNYNFLMLTSILFIKDRKSLSIPKVVDIVKNNPVDLEQFKVLNKDRPLLNELAANYTGIRDVDISNINNKLDSVKNIVAVVKSHRNQIWAHRDLEIVVPSQVTYDDTYRLLEVADEILQILTSKLNHESTSYVMIKPETIKNTQELVKLLRKDAEL